MSPGRVPRRLWGNDFRYRPLWPETFAILFDLPVPAEVASVLGWNTLPQGKIVTVEAPELKEETQEKSVKETPEETNTVFTQEIGEEIDEAKEAVTASNEKENLA